MARGHGPWPLANGPWRGPWPVACGPWPVAHGLAHGLWPMARCPWRALGFVRSGWCCPQHIKDIPLAQSLVTMDTVQTPDLQASVRQKWAQLDLQ